MKNVEKLAAEYFEAAAKETDNIAVLRNLKKAMRMIHGRGEVNEVFNNILHARTKEIRPGATGPAPREYVPGATTKKKAATLTPKDLSRKVQSLKVEVEEQSDAEPVESDELDTKTKRELIALAEAEGIEIDARAKKAQIIEALRNNLN